MNINYIVDKYANPELSIDQKKKLIKMMKKSVKHYNTLSDNEPIKSELANAIYSVIINYR